MTTFVIGNVAAVPDREKMAVYREKVLATLQAYGGGFAIRGGEFDVLEGGWHPTHLSVMQFPSAEHARRWYDSPEYAAITPLREGVEMDLILVDGSGSDA
ncbi:DUF1330 domain-containing protein [Sphaerisporangium dianthi]|uniref:DUF1330 domain-containing protein n=1 Tax=Sphaerisporangium dianthi TaxID=1436120 RepID=A0ABV9CDH6_9ACTN